MKNCPKCGCELEKEQRKKEARQKLAQLAEVLGLGSGGAWTQDMIVSSIEEHAEEFMPILAEILRAKAIEDQPPTGAVLSMLRSRCPSDS
jgi:hypothetical protein